MKQTFTRPAHETYSVYKVNEGGMGQVMALELLRNEGIDCERAHSPFVGQSGVRVYGNKRIQRKALRLLYNL